MIIVELFGGLGNQMFQYAFGRHLAAKRGDCLLLDSLILHSKRYSGTPRSFGLDIFNIRGLRLSTEAIVEKVQNSAVYTIFDIGFQPFHAVTVPPDISNIATVGWWQSEKYFQDSSDILRTEFTFKAPPSHTLLRQYVERLQQNESVCVHIRRTDYLGSVGERMGFVGLAYYEKAISTISSSVSNPQFFVFSDDIAWCKANLHLGVPLTFLELNMDDAHSTFHDFYLMSQCKHYIIANSSFSWWASWLGTFPRKIVIAPAGWYAGERSMRKDETNVWSSKDLIPRDWIRI